MKKRYELLENGICYPHNSFEKCSEGLEQAYEQAEQVLADYEGVDWGDPIEELEIQCVTYNEQGAIVECELVHEFHPAEANLGYGQ